MRKARSLLVVYVLLVAVLPAAALAQVATPAPDFGVARAASPVDLYDRLLTTPFPADLLPPGVAPLEPHEWRDSNDPDLAGSIGGVIFADGDPFGSELPTAIAYMVYPDADGPRRPLATASQFGEPTEFLIDGQAAPAVRAELEGVVGLFTVVDNVFVYGMTPTSEGAEELAVALAEAGVAHLVNVATKGAAAATPVSGATRDSTDPFLALAAAPFPADDLPFGVGSLVVLPMTVTRQEAAVGLENALLVRDADRTYPYPLVIYRFYADESAALDAISTTVQLAGMSAVGDLPPEIEIPYPTTLLDRTDTTTEVVVQVGATIVIGNAFQGDPDERHETAMRLAQIGVRHLEEVVGTGSVAGGEGVAGGDSPARLYQALLTATFPEALLPSGVGTLETSPWQDENDQDLAGSLGGVTYSTGDLLSTQHVSTISMIVYPDRAAAEQSLTGSVSFAESLGETPRSCAGVEAPSVEYEVAIMHVCIVQLDNVAISGMVLTFDDRPAEEKAAEATALAQAGIAFLEQMVSQS